LFSLALAPLSALPDWHPMRWFVQSLAEVPAALQSFSCKDRLSVSIMWPDILVITHIKEASNLTAQIVVCSMNTGDDGCSILL
jgi:hypothetical protein